MSALTAAALLATVALGSLWGISVLPRAVWTRRSPAAAILLWQALGLAGGVSAVGALLAAGTLGTSGVRSRAASQSGLGAGIAGALMRRFGSGHLTQPGSSQLGAIAQATCLIAGVMLLATLCWVLIVATVAVVRARRRQRALLALLAHGDPKVPGALVVDHPAAAAYCLPGLRSKIVVSVGTLDLLRASELDAVLAHERAHLRARHDLVLLPFSSLRRAFPRSRLVLHAQLAVALLIEMMADDRARRARPARELATALLRFGTAGAACAPSGALAAAAGDISARVNRLLSPPPPLPRRTRAAIGLVAATLAAVPVGLLIIP
jgi:Zn-dependent protease with chaperone function